MGTYINLGSVGLRHYEFITTLLAAYYHLIQAQRFQLLFLSD